MEDMEITFKQYVDMANIKDSMQLDSGTVIAEMDYDGYHASLEVRGEVKVWFNPNCLTDDNADPMDGDYYNYPSEFPKELKDIISGEAMPYFDGKIQREFWDTDVRVCVSDNNWFEIFLSRDRYAPDSDTVDVEGQKPSEIFDLLRDWIEERMKEDQKAA